MDFRELAKTEEYDFLRNDKRLGNRIILLGVTGSYGYGTNREGSDVDFRGITLELPSDLIGFTEFEQFEDRKTDTVIFGFNKIMKLLLGCNPNTIEILGIDEDEYTIKNEIGQSLLDRKEMFLTKRAAASFGHYADAQLRRLQNAIARDSMSQPDREGHIIRSVGHALDDYNRRSETMTGGVTKLYIDEAVTEGLEKEIFIDGELKHYPLRKYNEMMNTMMNVVKEYDKIGKRNNKKDDLHLNKHAMHLLRLFMMGIDILENKVIRTRRPDDELELLKAVRDGQFMKDSVLTEEFYKVVSKYEQMYAEAERNSKLPDNPDMEAVEKYVLDINRRIINGEI
ncbi:nucleotidyltransferase domain-containing protein [Eubacterium sp.]|uniref:DNA polymerase beta superfamily protein n=1 Tax=Eubacterium sp. TaxID=142586 RepID=UPI002600AD75|nr:nucleotidyltransferase domain-containing protein [Eubacterium sp.]MCR5628925.1 nucleotidyltransferase domain-containing protein [Eubacterium sp.]